MLRPLEGLLGAGSVGDENEVQMPSFAISPRARLATGATTAAHWPRCTYLGGDGILVDGASLLALSLLSWSCAGLVDASDARVESAGSCSDALLPCRCSGWCVNDATVELLDDGREMSRPASSRPTSSGLIEGSVLRSNAGGDVVLIEGRSKACSIDGLRNVSWA